MKTGDKNNYFILSGLILIVQLLLLYFVKYSNQKLSLTEFSITHTGNIINFIFILILIAGIFLLTLKTKTTVKKKYITLIIIIQFVLLGLSFIITKIDLPLSSSYILSQQGDKLLIGLSFTLYLYSILILLSIVWGMVFNKEKIIAGSFINGLFILAGLLLFSFIFINTKGYTSGKWALAKGRNNIGVVLGAAVWSDNQPSPTLSGRVDKAIELYKRGYINKILLTGSNAPGEDSEAAVALDYANLLNMDTSKIIIEEGTTSTTEQIKYIKNNISGYSSIVVISDSYHLPRVLEISDFYNIDIKVAASDRKLDFKSSFYNKVRESVALLIFWCFAL